MLKIRTVGWVPSGICVVMRITTAIVGRLCVAMCVLLAPLAARAQSAAAPDPDPVLMANVGFGGTLVAGRWNPIRASIEPGIKPISGFVVVTSGVEAATLSRSSAPFVSVPGVPVRIDQCVPLPRERWYYGSGGWINVRLVGEDGRLIRVVNFDLSGASTSLPLPPTNGSGIRLVGCVGRLSLDAAMKQWSTDGSTESNSKGAEGLYELWSNVVAAPMEPDDLPTHPAAYDPASVMVVATSVMDRLGDRSVDVLMSWVRGGGRLVLVGQTMGTDLSRWSIDGLAAVVTDAANDSRVTTTALGRAWGWKEKTLWPWGKSEVERPKELISMACGPVGLGEVSLIASDPGRADSASGSDMWKAVLQEAMAEGVQRSEYAYSNADDQMDRTPMLLDSMVEGLPTPGIAPMVIIVSIAVIMGLLMGPIDWFWLRRRKLGHWAWATALAWIALAGVAAFVWPNFARAGRSELRRIVVVDSVCGPDGRTESAWRTGVTCVMAATSGDRRFGGVDPRSMWRRLQAYEYGMQRSTSFMTDQRVGATPGPIPMSIWTLSSFRDDTPTAEAPTARIVADGDAYEVVVAGAVNENSVQAQVNVGSRSLEVMLERRPDGTLRGRTPNVPLTSEFNYISAESAADLWRDSERRYGYYGATHADSLGLTLSGVTARTRTMHDAIASGVWGGVCFTVRGEACDLTLEEPVKASQLTTYRILAVLEQATTQGEPAR